MFLNASIRWVTPYGEGGEFLFKQVVEQFSGKLMDFSALYRDMAAHLLEPAVQAKFDSEGAANEDSPWVELTEATRKDRKKHGFPEDHPILERTGELKDSFTSLGTDHVEEITPLSMVWGSRVKYAGYHQTGTKKMPARCILPVSSSLYDRMQAMIRKFVATMGRSTGFTVVGEAVAGTEEGIAFAPADFETEIPAFG